MTNILTAQQVAELLKKEAGYYELGEAPEVYDCEFCGCCECPDHCVWSVTCPICLVLPSEQCRKGNRYVGLHAERWELASGTT